MTLCLTNVLFAVVFPALLSAGAARQAAQATRDQEYWRSIVRRDYQVPEHESVLELSLELNALLGSRDPELRDELAYSILATWIANDRLSPQDLHQLFDVWRAQLRGGLGESGTDSVLKRSFSALCLASLTARDLKSPVLSAASYRALLDDALAYLRDERDLRGFEPSTRWIHATAHTADLLKNLAANVLLGRDDQRVVLDAVTAKLSSAPDVYTHGEQSRLARVVVAIVMRADFDRPSFDDWLAQLRNEDRASISQRPLTSTALAVVLNHTYMLEALSARLSMESLTGEGQAARDAVNNVLKRR